MSLFENLTRNKYLPAFIWDLLWEHVAEKEATAITASQISAEFLILDSSIEKCFKNLQIPLFKSLVKIWLVWESYLWNWNE